MQDRRALRARRDGECEGKASKEFKLCTHANGSVRARHHLEKEEKINRSSRRTSASPSTRKGRPEATHGCELLETNRESREDTAALGATHSPGHNESGASPPPPPQSLIHHPNPGGIPNRKPHNGAATAPYRWHRLPTLT